MICRLIATHPLISFFILAFLISWGTCFPWLAFGSKAFFVVFFIGSSGPAVAAWIVTKVTHGREGTQKLASSITKWRVGVPYWCIALGAFPLCLLVATGGYQLVVGEQLLPWRIPGNPVPYLSLWQFIASLPLLALLEEIGWRGFAWPKLTERFHPFWAGIFMGVLWAGWHMPLFFIPGMSHNHTPFLPYTALAVAVSICLGWISQRTRSVQLAAIMHTTLNYCGILLGPHMGVAMTFGGLIFGMAVLMLLLMHRQRTHER